MVVVVGVVEVVVGKFCECIENVGMVRVYYYGGVEGDFVGVGCW